MSPCYLCPERQEKITETAMSICSTCTSELKWRTKNLSFLWYYFYLRHTYMSLCFVKRHLNAWFLFQTKQNLHHCVCSLGGTVWKRICSSTHPCFQPQGNPKRAFVQMRNIDDCFLGMPRQIISLKHFGTVNQLKCASGSTPMHCGFFFGFWSCGLLPPTKLEVTLTCLKFLNSVPIQFWSVLTQE